MSESGDKMVLRGLVLIASWLVMLSAAWAQGAPGGTARQFDIAAQPLASGINVFGRQAGMQVVVDATVVSGVRGQAVSGLLTPEEALRRLLAGTGLGGRFTADGSVTLSRAPAGDSGGAMQLDPVNVQGNLVPSQAMIDNLPPPYAGGQVATGGQLGLLGNRGVMDTPFNQTNYTSKLVEDQQARTVGDVLSNDPSVRALRPAGSPSSEFFKIRGFNVDTPDMQYGGLYGVLPYWVVDAAIVERVEVLKGPSAMLSGITPGSSIGGTVNLVPKRAPDEPQTRATANYYSVGQLGGQIDVGRRFGPEKEIGVRFNGVYRAGQTAVQGNAEALGLALLGLDFRGERVRLSADLGYQDQKIDGLTVEQAFLAQGIPVPIAPAANRNFNQPWAYVHRKDLFGVVRAEFDLTERVTAYAAFGARDDQIDLLDAFVNSIDSPNGDFTSSAYRTRQFYTSQTGQVGVRGSFDTGPVNHAFSLNATGLWQQSGFGFAFADDVIASNIYNPTNVPKVNLPSIAASKASDSSFIGIAVADTLSVADGRIQLTLGGRQQYVGAKQYDEMGALTQSYYESAFSPSVALVVKPWQNVSLYGNFIQGLQQGTVVNPPFANAGDVFAPYKATQLEAGVKVDWGKFTTTVSVFQISQPSFNVDVPTNTLTLNGEQRNSGIEFNVFGEPWDGFRLLGGATFLNAILAKTQNGTNDGWWAPGTPNFTMNLAAEWDTPFLRGLSVNGRFIYTGSQYIGTDLPRRSISDWATFNVGGRYTIDSARSATGKPVAIRFNVENVFGTNYWMATQGLVLGPPRTFRLSLTADF